MVLAIAAATTLILAALFWGQVNRWQEKKRRQSGITTLAVGDGHTFVGGCLGITAYMGILFFVVWFTLDIIEETVSPDWLAWLVVAGLLVGFFAFVYWAGARVSHSFALSRLVLDAEGIRLVRRGKTVTAILWRDPWRLDQYAGVQFHYRHLGENYTDRVLWMALEQGSSRLLLRFDTTPEQIGGLPPYEGKSEGCHVVELADWLQVELTQRQRDRLPKAETSESNESLAEAGERLRSQPVRSPDPALMKALNFTEEDLVFNRDGAYKVRQLAYLHRDRWITLATYLLLALIFGGLAVRQVLNLIQDQSSQTTGPALVVFVLLVVFCALMVLITYADIATGIQIKRVRGTVTLQHYPQSGEYWLRIKDTAVPISAQIYAAFEDQAVYDLYFAYHGLGDQDRTLISAEGG